MRKILLLFFTGVTGVVSLAQTPANKDSLLRALQFSKEDTSTVRLLINIHKLYANKNYDSFYYYLSKADTLARKIKTDKFDFLINVGYVEYFYYNNEYRKSVEYGLKNKEIAEKQNDMKLLAKSYNNLAAIYNHFGQHRSAIDCILKCLDISEKTKDSASFPIRNLTASVTYYNLKQFDKSIFYSKKAVEFGKQFDNLFAVTMGLNNMGASYSAEHKVDTAISIFLQQLEFARKEEDIVNTCYALINLCHNYFFNGDLAGVEKYSTMLNKESGEMPDKMIIAEVHNVNALRYILRKDYSSAKTELDSGIALAKGEDASDALGNLYQTYSKFYFIQSRIREAEDYAYKYDSLQTAANLKELNFYIEDIEVKYETEKKQAQIQLQQAQLKQKSILNYVLIAGALALLIISLLTYRNYKHRQRLQQAKIEELETEKKLTATEAVLKGEEQERARLSKDLHDGLGGMLSGIKFSLSNMKENLIMTPENARSFERSIDMLDSSIREMRRVAHNMMPEILIKYGLDIALKEFCNEMDRSGVLQVNYQSVGMRNVTIEQITAVNIYRIIQELVNNAVKHAAARNVVVQLHANEQERLLAITVEDDGNGFDTSLLKQAGGIGWQNIQNRVEFLKGEIDIQSSDGKGTSVMIEIAI